MRAGFGARCMAVTIDGFIVLPLTWATEYLQNIALQQTLSMLVLVIYYVGFLGSRWQATPGMRLLKLEMRMADLRAVTHGRAAQWIGMSVLVMLLCMAPLAYVFWLIFSVMPLAELQTAMQSGTDPAALIGMIPERLGMSAEAFERTRIYGVLSTLFLLGFWCISTLVMKQQRGLHNLLASTLIVKVARP
ncbi:MAG: hypothetical protein EBU14_16615 [Acetobacteraceae bacterium]|nr:hypothetical protein [Acetobacteraceae bacterium]